MTKEYKPRNSWDFTVTVKVPCPECNQFYPEPEVKLHSEYVYGEGYFKLHCCKPCFDKAVKEKRASVKSTNWGM